MHTLSKERIVEAAQAQVEEHGHEAMTLRSLATALGVTAPALYDHFSSRDEILRAVAASGFEALVVAIDGSAGERHLEPGLERIRTGGRAYVRFAVERPRLFELMFLYRPEALPGPDDNELPAADNAFRHGIADVRQAIEDGDLADGDLLHTHVMLWAAVHGAAMVALMEPALADITATIVDAVVAGMHPDARRFDP